MPAILLSDCTTEYGLVAGIKIVKITTPATADTADTVDVSSLFKSGCFAIQGNATNGAALNAANWAKTITLTGAAANEARTIIAFGI